MTFTVARVDDKIHLGADSQVDDRYGVILPTDPAATDPFLLLAEDWFSTTGFEWHPHRGVETVTLVLDGVLEHGDNLGNAGALTTGDVHWMTAGRGIIHRELAYRADRRCADAGCHTAAPPGAHGAAAFLEAGELLDRRRVVLTQLGKESRPQLGRVAIHVFPPREAPIRDGAVKDQRAHSLGPRCRKHHGDRSTVTQTGHDGLAEADRVHDSLDLGSSLLQRADF